MDNANNEYPIDELPSTFEECKQLYLFFVSMSSSSSQHPQENTIKGLKTTLQYRLLKFVCPKGLLFSELMFIRSFEYQFPQFIFTVSSDLLRHKVCDCNTSVAPSNSVLMTDDNINDVSVDSENRYTNEKEGADLSKSEESTEFKTISSSASTMLSSVSEEVMASTSSNVCLIQPIKSSVQSEALTIDVALRQPSVVKPQKSKRRKPRRKQKKVEFIHSYEKTLKHLSLNATVQKPVVDLLNSEPIDTTWDEASDRGIRREYYRHARFIFNDHEFNLTILDKFFNVDPDFRYGHAIYAMDLNDHENLIKYTLEKYTKYDLTVKRLSLHHLALRQFILSLSDWQPPE